MKLIICINYNNSTHIELISRIVLDTDIFGNRSMDFIYSCIQGDRLCLAFRIKNINATNLLLDMLKDINNISYNLENV